jgi:hypothetical protein
MQKNPALPPDLRIPVIDEKYSVSKRVRTKDFIVEKRWVTKTVSIPVSVKYDSFRTCLGRAIFSSICGNAKDKVLRGGRRQLKGRGKEMPA